MAAAYHGREEICRALLSRGADPRKQDKRGRAAALARVKGNATLATLLDGVCLEPVAAPPRARSRWRDGQVAEAARDDVHPRSSKTPWTTDDDDSDAGDLHCRQSASCATRRAHRRRDLQLRLRRLGRRRRIRRRNPTERSQEEGAPNDTLTLQGRRRRRRTPSRRRSPSRHRSMVRTGATVALPSDPVPTTTTSAEKVRRLRRGGGGDIGERERGKTKSEAWGQSSQASHGPFPDVTGTARPRELSSSGATSRSTHHRCSSTPPPTLSRSRAE